MASPLFRPWHKPGMTSSSSSSSKEDADSDRDSRASDQEFSGGGVEEEEEKEEHRLLGDVSSPPPPPPPPAAKDLTDSGTKCFAKALLDFLNAEGSGFETYYSFISSFFLSDNDLRLSAVWSRPGLQEKIARQFYKPKDPSSEPQLFSFYSSPTLSKLCKHTGSEIVLYKEFGSAAAAGGVNRAPIFFPYFDQRCLRTVQTREGLLRPEGFQFRAGKTSRFFNDRYLTPSENLDNVDGDFNAWGLSSNFAFASKPSNSVSLWTDVGVCKAAETCLLAGSSDSFDLGSTLNLTAELLPLQCPGQLLESPELVESCLWRRWGKKVLMVTFTHHQLTLAERSNGRKSTTKGLISSSSSSSGRAVFPEPSRCKFVVLAFVRPPGCDDDNDDDKSKQGEVGVSQLGSLSGVPVVAYWGSGLCCLLSERYAESVRQSFFRTEGSGERLSNAKLRSYVPPSKARSDFRRQQLADRKSDRSKKVNSLKKWCRCFVCSGDKSFDVNMSRAGPEKLVTADLTLEQLLKLLGLWEGESTSRLLDQVCQLSVAAMDIESRTVELDLERPGPGPNVRYGEIDSAALETHSRCAQIPVMLAHIDGLSGQRDSRDLLTVDDDSEAGVRDVMKKYLCRVLDGQLRCSKKKSELLRPLFERTAAYKKSYVDYCSSWKASTLQAFEEEERTLKERCLSGGAATRVTPGGSSRKRAAAGDLRLRSGADGSLDKLAWDWDSFLTTTTTSSRKRKNEPSTSASVAGPADNSPPQVRRKEEEEECNATLGESTTASLLYQASMDALVKSRPSCLVPDRHLSRYLRLHQMTGDEDKRRGLSRDSEAAARASKESRKKKKKKLKEFLDLTARTWQHTLPGQLEKKLKRLVTDYSIFSFYG